MRQAKREDHWRHVYNKNDYAIAIESIKLTNAAPFVDQEIRINGAITVFCGANGVGKTSLLRIIEASLHARSAVRQDSRPYLGTSAAVEVVVSGKRGTGVNTAPRADAHIDVPVTLIDPINQYGVLAELSSKISTTPEMLEGYESKPADEERLLLLRAILGKDYKTCVTYELDDFDGYGPIPFFEVHSEGIAYDSRSMGLGELMAHFALWQIDRAPSGSILLLEEPETAIAPFSQEMLLTHLASQCYRKSAYAIITTHSTNIINLVPLDHIRLVSRFDGKVDIRVPDRESDLRDALGVDHPIRGLLLVEDHAAKTFLTYILENVGFPYVREFEIAIGGSDSRVISFLKFRPQDVRRLCFVGILDGDLRAKHAGVEQVLFLPGDVAPDVMLRQIASNDVDKTASAFNRDVPTMRRILGNALATESHDWLSDLAKNIGGMTTESVVIALSRIWLDVEENQRRAAALVSELCAKIDAAK